MKIGMDFGRMRKRRFILPALLLLMCVSLFCAKKTYAVTNLNMTVAMNDIAQDYQVKLTGVQKNAFKFWLEEAESEHIIATLREKGIYKFVDLDLDGTEDILVGITNADIVVTPAELTYSIIGDYKPAKTSSNNKVTFRFPGWMFIESQKLLVVKDQTVLKDLSGSAGQPWFHPTDDSKNYRDKIVTLLVAGNVKKIGDYTFSWLKNLSTVNIQAPVEEIGESAFWRCTDGLKTIDIPASVKTIGSGAFHECDALTEVILRNKDIKLEKDYPNSGEGPEDDLQTIPWGNEAGVTVKAHVAAPAKAYCDDHAPKITFEPLCKAGSPTKEKVVEATCSAKGSYEEVTICTECGGEVSRELVEVPKLEHVPEKTVTRAEPGKAGKIEYICSVCHTVTASNPIPAPDTFTPEKTEYVYTGSGIEPTLTIKDTDANTIPAANYKLSYIHNTDAGTGTIMVTFLGDTYIGSKEVAFTITPKSLAGAKITAEDQKYTGEPVVPAVTVVLDGTPLAKDKDFTVEYKDNTEAGKATVTVTGTGNFKDAASTTFQISKEDGTAASEEPSAAETATLYATGDITPKKPAKLTTVEKSIYSNADDTKDMKGSTYSLLKAKGVAKSGRSIKISWTKVPGATKYLIYGNRCGKGKKYLFLDTVKKSKSSWTKKKLKKGTYYKVLVVAVKGSKVLATSKTIHVATNGGTKGNPTGLTLTLKKKAVSTLTLKKGKSKTIKAAVKVGKLKVNTHRKVAWESDNLAVAKVNSKGKITGVGQGTCHIFAYAQNGISAMITVTVP